MSHRIPQMAVLKSNWLAVLFLAMTVAVSLMGQLMSPMIAAAERPAGCHQHGSVPAPQPVSYRCCQSGHDSAILQIPLTAQLDSTDLCLPVELSPVLATAFRPGLRSLAISSPDPPLNLPLRV
jgi:hypothetical protein